jgi:hypothetical protein
MWTAILVLLVLVCLLERINLTVDFKKTTDQKSGKRPRTGRFQ